MPESEGSPVSLAGVASDPEGNPLTKTWTLATTGDPGVSCALAGAATLSPTVTCTDDALVTATLSVSDGVNARGHGGRAGHHRQCRTNGRDAHRTRRAVAARSVGGGEHELRRCRDERHPHRDDRLG